MQLRRLAWAAMYATLLPSYWKAITSPAVGLYRDDGIYLVSARALAEGRGYRIASHPEGIPQTKYPPLYPFLLSLAWRAGLPFPASLVALKTLNAALLAVWLWLSHRFLTRRMEVPPWASAGLLWIVAASGVAWDAAAFLLSEALFGALLAAALLWVTRLEDSPGDRRALAATVLLGAAAFYTRTIGLTVAASAALALLARRRRREALAAVLLSGVLMAPWWVWQRVHADGYTTAPQRYYTADNYRDWNTFQARTTAAAPATAIPGNLGYLLYFPVALLRLGAPLQRFGWLAMAACVALWALAARGMTARPPGAALALLGCYLAVILNWSWIPYRFLLPLAPLLAGFLYLGTPRRARRPLVLLGVGVAALASLASRPPAHTERWAGFLRSAEWVSRHTQPGDIIGTTYDAGTFLYSGRHAVNFYATEPMVWYHGKPPDLARKVADAERTLREWRVTYIVESGGDRDCDPDYPALIEALQRRGRVRRIEALGPGLNIYRVIR